MLDYDAARAKVRKLVEKPADDTTKLPRVCFPFDSSMILCGGSLIEAELDIPRLKQNMTKLGRFSTS